MWQVAAQVSPSSAYFLMFHLKSTTGIVLSSKLQRSFAGTYTSPKFQLQPHDKLGLMLNSNKWPLQKSTDSMTLRKTQLSKCHMHNSACSECQTHSGSCNKIPQAEQCTKQTWMVSALEGRTSRSSYQQNGFSQRSQSLACQCSFSLCPLLAFSLSLHILDTEPYVLCIWRNISQIAFDFSPEWKSSLNYLFKVTVFKSILELKLEILGARTSTWAERAK